MKSYLLLLQRYGLLILLSGLIGLSLATWLVFFVVRPSYQVQTSLLVLEQRPAGLSSLVSRFESSLELIDPLRGAGLGGASSSSLEDLVSILRSRSLAEQVQAQVKLQQLPEVQQLLADLPETLHQQVLVKYLRSRVTILPPDARQGTLRIRVELSEPVLATRIANLYVEALKDYSDKWLNREQSTQLRYLEQQLTEMETQLQQSEQDLLRFQKTHQTVALDGETQQLIKNLAALEAEEISAQAAWQAAQAQRQFLDQHAWELSPDSTQTRNKLELDLTGLQERRQALTLARKRYQASLSQLPERALELARVERQLSLRGQLYLLLQQQTQAARLEAARTVELFRVLDPAIVPYEPARPVKGLWLAISGMMSIALGIGMAAVHDYATRIQKESYAHAHPDTQDDVQNEDLSAL